MTIQKIIAMMLVLVCLFCVAGCRQTADVQYSEGDDVLPEGGSKELNDMLYAVTRIHVGSDNEVASAVVVARDLLDWGATTKMSEQEIVTAAQVYYDTIGETSKMLYEYRLSLLSSALNLLENEETRASALADAGSDSEAVWDADVFEKVKGILKVS